MHESAHLLIVQNRALTSDQKPWRSTDFVLLDEIGMIAHFGNYGALLGQIDGDHANVFYPSKLCRSL